MAATISECEFVGPHEAHYYFIRPEGADTSLHYLCPGVGSVRRIVERVQPNEEML